jgi:hypothetical protein
MAAAGRRPWLVDLGDLNNKAWVPLFAAVTLLVRLRLGLRLMLRVPFFAAVPALLALTLT